jgi:hypothetical protein
VAFGHGHPLVLYIKATVVSVCLINRARQGRAGQGGQGRHPPTAGHFQLRLHFQAWAGQGRGSYACISRTRFGDRTRRKSDELGRHNVAGVFLYIPTRRVVFTRFGKKRMFTRVTTYNAGLPATPRSTAFS